VDGYVTVENEQIGDFWDRQTKLVDFELED
jgi:hypothetical protein